MYSIWLVPASVITSNGHYDRMRGEGRGWGANGILVDTPIFPTDYFARLVSIAPRPPDQAAAVFMYAESE